VEESKQCAACAPRSSRPPAQVSQAEFEELSDRVDAAEKHSVLDRIEFSGDMRVKADSLDYDNVTLVEPPMVPDGAGGYLMNMNPDGTYKRSKYNLDNDILYTTRLRLNMKRRSGTTSNSAAG